MGQFLKTMSKDEKRAMSILQTLTVLKNQRYEIPLLCKEDHPKLLNNKELALPRLYSLEKKLEYIDKRIYRQKNI